MTVGFEFYSLKADDYGLTPISYGYGYRRDVNGLLSSIFSRYFIGNTFAINTGLIYAKYKEFGYLMSHKNTDYYNLDASIISLKAGLGNYWKWNFGLTFGFEWVGFVLPAIQKTNTVTWSSDGAEYEGKKSVDKLSQTNIQFLTLSLGYEF